MTTIELITSFALATVIFVILFNLLLSLKDVYLVSGMKTTMLIEQSNLSKSLNDSINSSHPILDIDVVSEDEYYSEYTITTNEGPKNLIVDLDNKKITFDKYVLSIPQNVEVKLSDEYFDWENIGTYIHLYNNKLLVIDIPLFDTKNSDSYDIKLVYQFDEYYYYENGN